ncbi:MAG TPA: hypothetical protein VGT60_12515 [Candidatus Limnocylindria bacterium]|nr:hypothetical protein [Candidatus Limnocylindria bacterium]
MTRRARRRGRSSGRGARTLPRHEKALAEYQERERRLKRFRTLVGFLGLVPLVGSLACDGGLTPVCVPWSWSMGLWAVVFGAFVGLSIRLIRERRQFEARQPRAS